MVLHFAFHRFCFHSSFIKGSMPKNSPAIQRLIYPKHKSNVFSLLWFTNCIIIMYNGLKLYDQPGAGIIPVPQTKGCGGCARAAAKYEAVSAERICVRTRKRTQEILCGFSRTMTKYGRKAARSNRRGHNPRSLTIKDGDSLRKI